MQNSKLICGIGKYVELSQPHLSYQPKLLWIPCRGLQRNKCVVVTESDGEANTRLESTDYGGFYVELGGE